MVQNYFQTLGNSEIILRFIRTSTSEQNRLTQHTRKELVPARTTTNIFLNFNFDF
jgi:hypothetical protein